MHHLDSALGDKITNRELRSFCLPDLNKYKFCLCGVLQYKAYINNPCTDDNLTKDRQHMHKHNNEVCLHNDRCHAKARSMCL